MIFQVEQVNNQVVLSCYEKDTYNLCWLRHEYLNLFLLVVAEKKVTEIISF